MGLHNNEVSVVVKAKSDQASFAQVKKAFDSVLSEIDKKQASMSVGTANYENLQKQYKLVSDIKDMYQNAFNTNLGSVNVATFNQKLTSYMDEWKKQNKGVELSMVDIQNAFKSIGVEGSRAFNTFSTDILTSNRGLKETKTILQEMGTTMMNTIKWGLSSSVMNSFTGSLSQAYSYVKNLDSALNNIRIVSQQSSEQMAKFAENANRAAQALGSTTLDYADAALIYYQQGLSDKEVQARTDTTIKMANVLGVSAEEVSNYMTAVWNNFDDGSKSLEYYADVITKLGAATASSAEEISDGLEKFAAVADTVGLSYEYATAALATVTSETRQSADVVGTAFKTLFARIQDLELGETLEDGVTLGKYSQALAAVGVSVKDSNGELRNMDDILSDMGAKWDTLSQAQKVSLAQTVAGTRQYTQLVALMDNWDVFTQNLTMAYEATGELDAEQSIYLESTEAHLNAAQAAWDDFKDSLLDESVINFFADLSKVLGNISSLFVDSMGGGLSFLAGGTGLIMRTFSSSISSSLSDVGYNYTNSYKKNKNAIESENIAKDIFKGQDLGTEKTKEIKDHIAHMLSYGDLVSETQSQEIKDLLKIKAEQENIRDIQKERLTTAKEFLEVQNLGDGFIASDFDLLNEDVGKSKESQIRAQAAMVKYFEQSQSLESGLGTLEDTFSTKPKVTRQKVYKPGETEQQALFAEPAKIKETAQELKDFNESSKALLGIWSNDQMTGMKDTFKDLIPEKELAKIEKAANVMEKMQKKLQDNPAEMTQKDADQWYRASHTMYETMSKTLEQTDEKAKQVNDTLSDPEAYRRITDTSEKIRSVDDNLGEIYEKLDATQKIDMSVNAVGSILQIGSAISTVTSSLERLDDESIPLWERLTGVVTGGLTAFLLFSTAAKTLATTVLPQLCVVTKTYTSIEVAETMIKEKGVFATLKQIAATMVENKVLATNKMLKGGLILIIIALVAVTATWIANIIKANSEEAKLTKQLEAATEAAKKAKEAYDSLKDSVSGYESAIENLKKLEEGTVEFYEAIITANEQAQKLIDTLGLMPGTGYTLGANGLIQIDEDALENAMYKEMQNVYRTQGHESQAKANLEKYNQDKIVGDFMAAVNKEAQKQGSNVWIDKQQAKAILDNSKTDSESPYLLGELDNRDLYNTVEDTIRGRQRNYGIDLDELNKNSRRDSELICNAVEENANTVETAVEQNGINIGEVIKDYLPQYMSSQSKIEAYEKQAMQNSLYGYLDKDTTTKYRGMSSGSQDAILEIMKNTQKNTSGITWNEDLSGWKYAEEMEGDNWKWWDILLHPIKTGAKLALEGDMEDIKDEYLIKAKGYSKDEETGAWTGPNGEPLNKEDLRKAREGVDIYTAIDAHNSGEYNTEQNYKDEVQTVLDTAQQISTKNNFNDTSSGKIEEALLRLKAGTADDEFFKTLTNEEKAALQVTGTQSVLYSDGTTKSSTLVNGVESQYSWDQINGWLAPSEDEGRSPERVREDLEKYNATLATTAERLGTTKEALGFFGIAMHKASGEIDDHTKESAENIAKQYEFNKAYNNAVDTYYDNKDAIEAYKKALESGEEVSYDLADAMGELAGSLKDMFGTEVSADFIVDNFETIQTILTGTEEQAKAAYKEIQALLNAEAITNALGEAMTLAEEDLTSLATAIANLGPNMTLDQQMANQLISMVNNAKMSISEMEALFNSMHLEIPPYEVQENKIEVDSETIPENKTRHHYDGTMIVPDAEAKDGYRKVDVNYWWDEWTDEYQYSYVKINDNVKLKSTGGGGTNFKLSQGNQKAKAGGSSKPKSEKRIDDPKDRYHDVNVELKQIANELSKVQDEQEGLVGGDLIANLQKQYNLLNQEIDKTAEKLGIAKEEQEELANRLSGQGVKFNSDGTIANYAEAWDNQLAYVNSIIDKYNSMDAKGQEAYQATLDAAKENWNKFKEDMSRYDELLTGDIAELEAQIRKDLNKQIEIKLEAFEYEIKLRLDMSEAERDWNEFKKKIIDGIKDDDILGNAEARLKDFDSYYKENGTGEIQASTKHVNNILDQLKQMDADQAAGVYGETYTYTNASGEEVTVDYNNRKQALEDLKEYYTQIMSSMMDLQELEEEIHQSYLDMMDEAQEKFDEQLETYQTIDEIIQHDMNLVKLMYGDSAGLADYYKEQRKNLDSQLDFQKQQVAFWKNQMDTLEKGSDAWEKAKENWMAAGAEWRALAEQNIQTITDEYIDAINTIFETLNNSITDNKGLEYIGKEWELINKEADRYLDQVNAIYETQTLQNKYLDAIEDATNPAQQKKINDLMEDEIALLREKDKLSQYDIDRANLKYEIAMKQMALEESQQKKTQLRLRRDSQGNYTYQYTNDDSEVSKLKTELSDLYNQLYNLDAGKYKENLDELYSIWEEFHQEMNAALQINDPDKRKDYERQVEEKYGKIINAIVADNENIKANLQQSTMSQLVDLYDQNTDNYKDMTDEQQEILDNYISEENNYNNAAFDNLFGLYNKNLVSFDNMTQEEIDILMKSFLPQWKSGVQKMADEIVGKGGFAEVTKTAIEEAMKLASIWDEERTAAYTEAQAMAEEMQTVTQGLTKDNNKLIETYGQELEAVKGIILELGNMKLAYEQAELAAQKAAKAAYEYWQAANNENAGTNTNINTEDPKKPGEEPKKEEKKVNTAPSAPSLSVGSTVSVKPGTKWYADSYGGGSWGYATGGKIAYVSNGPYGYNIGGSGWIRKTDIVGYDTGGYTGDWNNTDGKLAMLHQKELVLNANDTKNILNAVEILRNITSNLGQALMNQMASISANNTSAITNTTGNDTLEQTVHINAQFPNVRNSNEIETAINNLVNMASQHIQKN